MFEIDPYLGFGVQVQLAPGMHSGTGCDASSVAIATRRLMMSTGREISARGSHHVLQKSLNFILFSLTTRSKVTAQQ